MKENKRQRIYRTIMLIVVVALITFVVTTTLMYNGSIKYIVSTKSTSSSGVAKKIDLLLATITELIEEKYIGEINEEELVDGALRGMVESIGDAYTVYYSKEELEDFTTSTLGNFVGIGVYMQANLETGEIDIISPIEGSPAEEAGIKAGDQILKADGKEYTADKLDELSNHIKGEEGTEVTLTIKRGEDIIDIAVKRGAVNIQYVASEMLDDNIGYIVISTFDEDSSKDFEKEYEAVLNNGAKSLIIDLRNNGRRSC